MCEPHHYPGINLRKRAGGQPALRDCFNFATCLTTTGLHLSQGWERPAAVPPIAWESSPESWKLHWLSGF